MKVKLANIFNILTNVKGSQVLNKLRYNNFEATEMNVSKIRRNDEVRKVVSLGIVFKEVILPYLYEQNTVLGFKIDAVLEDALHEI